MSSFFYGSYSFPSFTTPVSFSTLDTAYTSPTQGYTRLNNGSNAPDRSKQSPEQASEPMQLGTPPDQIIAVNPCKGNYSSLTVYSLLTYSTLTVCSLYTHSSLTVCSLLTHSILTLYTHIVLTPYFPGAHICVLLSILKKNLSLCYLVNEIRTLKSVFPGLCTLETMHDVLSSRDLDDVSLPKGKAFDLSGKTVNQFH